MVETKQHIFLDTELFKHFVWKGLKMKDEASGWRRLQRNEKEDELIELYKEQYDIDIHLEKVIFNPGIRLLAKLILPTYVKCARNFHRWRDSLVEKSDCRLPL